MRHHLQQLLEYKIFSPAPGILRIKLQGSMNLSQALKMTSKYTTYSEVRDSSEKSSSPMHRIPVVTNA
jgi:hypothetical protein